MNEAETAAMFANLQQLLGRSLTRNDMEPLAWALYQTGKNVSAAKYSQSLIVGMQQLIKWLNCIKNIP
jgi:amidase